jgi:hypothetical protein
VSLYNPSYAHVLDNTEPFPEAEYESLVKHFLTPSDVYSTTSTRQGTERKMLLRVVSRLSE